MKTILILVAPSCAGKTTIEEKLVKEQGYTQIDIIGCRDERYDGSDTNYSQRNSVKSKLIKRLRTHIHTADIDLGKKTVSYEYWVDTTADKLVVSFINRLNAIDFINSVALSTVGEYVCYLQQFTVDRDTLRKCLEDRGCSEKEITNRLNNYIHDNTAISRDDVYKKLNIKEQ